MDIISCGNVVYVITFNPQFVVIMSSIEFRRKNVESDEYS